MSAVSGAAVPVSTRKSFRGLAVRIASGIVAVPFLLGLAYLGTPGTAGGVAYGAFICLGSVLAAVELRAMLRSGGYVPVDVALIGVALLLPLDAWLRASTDVWAIAPDGMLILAMMVILSLVSLLIHRTSERALVDWALSLGLALYVGGLMQFYMP